MTDTLPTTSAPISRHISRRSFLATTGAATAGIALVSTTRFGFAAPASVSALAPAADAAGDLTVARLAASLEVLAVGTYKAALDAATAGKLGSVPPAVGTFAQTAMSQHQFALDKWNGVITGAGSPAVNAPPADLNAAVQAAFGKVTDVGGVAALALMLEQVAADTYYKAIPTLSDSGAISLAGNFQIIDRQHQSILLFVMGQYPVPQSFQQGDMAAQPPSGPAPSSAPPASSAPASSTTSSPAPQGGPTPPAADGQSLSTQSGATQAMFRAVWGAQAGTEWVMEHNKAIGR